MGILQSLARGIGGNKSELKGKYREAEQDLRVEQTLQERQKSSNRRELERYYKEQEEEQIKNELKKIRKKRDEENWNSPNKVIGGKATMLNDDRPILKEKNIFQDSNNLFNKQNSVKHSMGFFK